MECPNHLAQYSILYVFDVFLSKQDFSLAAAMFRNLKSNAFLFLSHAYDFYKTILKKKGAQLLILKDSDFNIKHCPGTNGKGIIDPRSLLLPLMKLV